MLFNSAEFNLIQKSENVKMYNYQKELLSHIDENNGENVIRLSILLTLAPVGDYGEALKLISFFSFRFNNIKLKIIENYMKFMWGNGINIAEFEKLLTMDICRCDEFQSMIYYLIALQYEENGNTDEAKESIRLSVEKYSFHVNNLLMYAKYFEADSEKYYKMARDNLRKVNVEGLEAFTNPDVFIGEFISGIYSQS